MLNAARQERPPAWLTPARNVTSETFNHFVGVDVQCRPLRLPDNRSYEGFTIDATNDRAIPIITPSTIAFNAAEDSARYGPA